MGRSDWPLGWPTIPAGLKIRIQEHPAASMASKFGVFFYCILNLLATAMCRFAPLRLFQLANMMITAWFRVIRSLRGRRHF